MMSRAGHAGLVLTVLLAGCSNPLGKVLVTVVFENETRTKCIKTTASKAGGADINSNPAFLPRGGKDLLQIGLAETPELVGEVDVTIARFADPDCGGTAFASQTQPTTLVHGGPVAKLEFRFVGASGNDGGTDGGADDGGVDAGCDVDNCANAPGECELTPATGCSSDGGCRFTFKTAGTTCSAGVCNSGGGCIADVCAVAAPGTSCNDGLGCTPNSTCDGNKACVGTCAAAPECNLTANPVSCDPNNASACLLVPHNNFNACTLSPGARCLDGGCRPWLDFFPLNFPVANSIAVTPYPTSAWTLASQDGGLCDTVISTGPTPMVTQGDCGTPVLTSTVDDAGVLVLTTTGLDVGPNARLSFVGTRPVQLVVIGDATIAGVVSVAPLIPGQPPAGTGSSRCANAQPGDATKKGGGGGGFGESGGRGGEAGGTGGGRTSEVVPLRGGCPGAAGFRVTGESPGGLGGGAIQLIVADTLTVSGVVTASGGGGTQGLADAEGGGGGGSGGTVILEARLINLTGGAVTANGGGGGEGGGVGDGGVAGAQGPIASATAAPAADNESWSGGAGGKGGDDAAPVGEPAGNGMSTAGGGGGGGAVGAIFVRASMTCTRGGGVLSGDKPLPFSCN